MQKDFSKDPGEPAFSPARSSASALNKNLRRSERVFLNLRVRISAAESAEDFPGEGQTVDVSQHGAAIKVDRDLDVGEAIKVRRVGVNKEAWARVVASYKDHGFNSRVFGIVLTDCNVNLWDVVFPKTGGSG